MDISQRDQKGRQERFYCEIFHKEIRSAARKDSCASYFTKITRSADALKTIWLLKESIEDYLIIEGKDERLFDYWRKAWKSIWLFKESMKDYLII